MNTTRELVDRAVGMARADADAPPVVALVLEILGRGVIALEDLAHHFNALGRDVKTDAEEPSASVYAVPGCTFNYCPHPDVCRETPGGCTQAPR